MNIFFKKLKSNHIKKQLEEISERRIYMTIKIRNQRPATIYKPYDMIHVINPTLSIDEYHEKLEEDLRSRIIEPMFNPINNNNPVRIEDTAFNPPKEIDQDTLFNAIIHLWTSDTLDVNVEKQVNEIYRQGIQHTTQNDWYFDRQLGIEALVKTGLPIPSQSGANFVQYTAALDVIPSAKNFLANMTEDEATNWFANIVGFTHDKPNNYLLVTVQTSDVFNNLKENFQNYVQAWSANHTINHDTMRIVQDFNNINIDDELSVGIFLPNGGGGSLAEQEALSFTRMLMYTIGEFESSNQGLLTAQPIDLRQLYLPENIVFLNLENYAHAKASEINKSWSNLEKALNAKKSLNFISNKRLMTTQAITLTGTQKKSSSAGSRGQQVARAKVRPFSGKPIKAKHMLRMMKHVIENHITNQRTENTYKTEARSFMRPNRRDPMNHDLQGKVKNVKYRPDIHIYIDTSGSISESQYRDGVSNLIALAKMIDSNIYITSFSHYVSQTTLLRTKGKSVGEIYKQFLRIPKVQGGTDFEQVWMKIDKLHEHNQRNGHSYQINFIITDFGYSLSRGFRWNPNQASLKHTFYVPISADQHTWDQILRYVKDFTKEMRHAGDRTIRQRILM